MGSETRSGWVSGPGLGSRIQAQLMPGQHTKGLCNTKSRRLGGEQARELKLIAAEGRSEKDGSWKNTQATGLGVGGKKG